MMKRLLAMAAFLLASNAAQAQYQFEYGGRTIRIDPDRGTISIPGVYDNTGKKSRRAKSDTTKSDQDTPRGKQDARTEPQASPAPAETVAAPPAPLPPATATSPGAPSPATATNAPSDTTVVAPPAPPPPAPLPSVQQAAPLPSAPPPPAATVATAPPQVPAQAAPEPAQRTRDTSSPVGVWLTEEKEGKVRIEQCGNNLCGYSVDAKSNANGEQVLINMRLGKDQKWSGRILDPNSGSTYDSTIAMKGPDTLHVQGCAFGGMFCGGQTWSRVN
jgi:uncharacterized protein (DUF2147 family)